MPIWSHLIFPFIYKKNILIIILNFLSHLLICLVNLLNPSTHTTNIKNGKLQRNRSTVEASTRPNSAYHRVYISSPNLFNPFDTFVYTSNVKNKKFQRNGSNGNVNETEFSLPPTLQLSSLTPQPVQRLSSTPSHVQRRTKTENCEASDDQKSVHRRTKRRWGRIWPDAPVPGSGPDH